MKVGGGTLLPSQSRACALILYPQILRKIHSFIIGTACATADVNVTSKNMRRITTLHCVVAFFFNTTILALTVNVGAGFF